MPIHWNPKLSVGLTQIDGEHQELFVRINRLMDAMAAARARDEIVPLFTFLDDYVTTHFGGEQQLMAQHRFPGQAEHLKAHAYFAAELARLRGEFEVAGASAFVTIKLNRLLCEWFREHVATADRKLGAYVVSDRSAHPEHAAILVA